MFLQLSREQQVRLFPWGVVTRASVRLTRLRWVLLRFSSWRESFGVEKGGLFPLPVPEAQRLLP